MASAISYEAEEARTRKEETFSNTQTHTLLNLRGHSFLTLDHGSLPDAETSFHKSKGDALSHRTLRKDCRRHTAGSRHRMNVFQGVNGTRFATSPTVLLCEALKDPASLGAPACTNMPLPHMLTKGTTRRAKPQESPCLKSN